MNEQQDYWENNIEGFSGFYDTTSEETIKGNRLFIWWYKKFIFPMEKRYMMIRHGMVSNFIDRNVKKDFTVADIGCGSGIYSKKIANKVGSTGKVFALDFTTASINLVNRNLSEEEKNYVTVQKFDIVKESIPKVDIAISIGVLPYINNASIYLKHILPYTDELYFNFLDSDNILNKIRLYLPFLNARNYSYHSYVEVVAILSKDGFLVKNVEKLATGKMIHAKRN